MTEQGLGGPGSFYQNYLHALYVTDDALGNVYTGQNTFSNLSADISPGAGDAAQYTRFVDAITPLGSQLLFISITMMPTSSLMELRWLLLLFLGLQRLQVLYPVL